MPIEFHVNPQENDVFYWTFADYWTIQEYAPIHAQANEMMEIAAPKPIFVIADMRTSGPAPRGFFDRVEATSRRGPANWVVTVVIARGSLLQRLLGVFNAAPKSISQRYIIVDTLEKALVAIRALRKQRTTAVH